MDTLEFRTIKFIAVVGWIQAPVVCTIELIARNFPTSLRYAPGQAFKLRAFKPFELNLFVPTNLDNELGLAQSQIF